MRYRQSAVRGTQSAALVALALFGAAACLPDAPVSAPVETLDPIADARRATVRVRNLTCHQGVGVGSGVFIRPDLLATNRHVVEGAHELEVNTWDGETKSVSVVAKAEFEDVAFVRTSTSPLSTVGQLHPELLSRREKVTILGHPGGGQLESHPGNVVDYVDGRKFDQAVHVLRVRGRVRHGNSGGPLVDGQGRIRALVFGVEVDTDYGLAIPASAVQAALDEAVFALPEDCTEPAAP